MALSYNPTTEIDPDNLADRWMLGRIQTTLAGMEDDFRSTA
jgi:valyl-tRNA synthetase